MFGKYGYGSGNADQIWEVLFDSQMPSTHWFDAIDQSTWAVIGFLLMLVIVLMVLFLVALWRIFEKNNKEGWRALVPVYNMATLYEIVGIPSYLALFVLTAQMPHLGDTSSLALILLYSVSTVKLGALFKKSNAFILGMVFLPFIFYPILGFSKDKVGNKK